MLSWLMRRRMAAFERSYNYDLSYGRHLLAVSTRAFLVLARLLALSKFREGVPAEAWYAAKIAAAIAEDCGPCTQLVVTMAERGGVSPTVLRAIIAGDPARLPADAALGLRFAQATLRHDPAADALRDEILARWGEPALVSLAFAITAGRLFPTLKYALGHGQACARVVVGGEPAPVIRRAA